MIQLEHGKKLRLRRNFMKKQKRKEKKNYIEAEGIIYLLIFREQKQRLIKYKYNKYNSKVTVNDEFIENQKEFKKNNNKKNNKSEDNKALDQGVNPVNEKLETSSLIFDNSLMDPSKAAIDGISSDLSLLNIDSSLQQNPVTFSTNNQFIQASEPSSTSTALRPPMIPELFTSEPLFFNGSQQNDYFDQSQLNFPMLPLGYSPSF